MCPPNDSSTRSSRPNAAPRRRRASTAARASIALLATGLLLAAPADSNQRTTGAHAARTFTLDESGSLRLTSKHGFTLNERGTATGTVKGTIYVHLTIVSSKRVSAEVNIYPSNGSITGYGAASYQRKTTFAVFSGTMSIARGTGAYSRAHGSGLSFGGTIQKSDDAVTVHVSGRVSD